MLRHIAGRVLGAVPVVLLVALGIFALVRLAPGDAASTLAAEDATEADLARMRAQWGLDQPVLVQFFYFLTNLARLDFGTSYRYHAPVTELIGQRLPATIELAVIALLIAAAIAVPLGVATALRKGSWLDGLGSLVAVLGVSAPSFWIGILLVLFVSGYLNLLPSSGRIPLDVPLREMTGFVLIDSLLQGQVGVFRQGLEHILLPATTLAFGMIGIIARISRSAVIDVGQEEFVVTAVAKGLKRREVVRNHLLPNATVPIITIIGLELGTLISGSIVVEVVFSWPGLGSLLYSAVTSRDIPLTTGIVISYTFIFISLNVLVDLVYVLIDPRLRVGRA
ncbi:MAG: ABC transporter permease [Bosea sp.]|jgi:peptide/nickel transport system permease protein|uniref:ABC transporter permease n=1 Tax=Hyphomicrobiales TaxID=356 RepID=UPI0009E950EE|nr:MULTISPECIES: ABC transporter permease [Hyphomicrobiales]MCP4561835.1 ABC transporter permease [Bosea sp. (in: a-proteobacteria)]MCP4738204.1 ABC transporter permease [Bosea sp. (in: a-proteobacteria)]MDX3804840.1 ABC transporter permease [Bosea sp. (in: a-proteobacteria)]